MIEALLLFLLLDIPKYEVEKPPPQRDLTIADVEQAVSEEAKAITDELEKNGYECHVVTGLMWHGTSDDIVKTPTVIIFAKATSHEGSGTYEIVRIRGEEIDAVVMLLPARTVDMKFLRLINK